MINKYYNKQMLDEVKKYIDNSHLKVVTLKDFLNSEFYTKIEKIINKYDYDRHIIPDLESYNYSVVPKEFETFVKSKEFKDFVKSIFGSNIEFRRISLQKFGWQDYTILRDDSYESNKLIFELTPSWDKKYGGISYFVKDDLTQEFFPSENTLTIIKEDKIKHFVKYINHYAKNNARYIITIE